MRRSQRLDVSPTTIATWIGAHKEQTKFRRRRAEATTIYPPEQTIRSIKLSSPGLRLA
jgi:transposase-like protein